MAFDSEQSELPDRPNISDFDHVHKGLDSGGFLFTSTRTKAFIEEVKYWSDTRHRLAKLLQAKKVEAFLGIVVVISLALVVVEADTLKNPPFWLPVADWVVLIIFAVEVAIRIFIFRGKFFCSALNILDLVSSRDAAIRWHHRAGIPGVFTRRVLVVSDATAKILEIAAEGSLPSLVALRLFRSLRFTRTLKIMVKFPKLALLVKGLINAVSAVMYGVSLTGVLLLFWAVVAVHFVQPVNERVSAKGTYHDCPRCDRAFATVFQSMLTFSQQILAGDSWGQVTIPIIEESPLTSWFFAMVFVSIHIALLNVILAVIVDTALKTSQEDAQHIVKQKRNEFAAAAARLERICEEMDTDGSGDLTKSELQEGYNHNPEFRELLEAMDVSEEDLDMLFVILDADGDGNVNYEEFIGELHKMKAYDNHTLLIFIKHYVTEIRNSVHRPRSTKGRRSSTGYVQDSVSLDGARLEVKDVAKPVVAAAPPADLKVQEKRKDLDLAVTLPPATSTRDLLEDIGSLRTVICEEVASIMSEIAQKSEGYARLLASMAEDPSTVRVGEAATSVYLRPDANAVSSSTLKGRRRASAPVEPLCPLTLTQDVARIDRSREAPVAGRSQPQSLTSGERSGEEQGSASEPAAVLPARCLGSSCPGPLCPTRPAVGAVGGGVGSAGVAGSGGEAGAAQAPASDSAAAPSSAWRAQKGRGGRRNRLVPAAVAELEQNGGPSSG